MGLLRERHKAVRRVVGLGRAWAFREEERRASASLATAGKIVQVFLAEMMTPVKLVEVMMVLAFYYNHCNGL